MPLHWAHQILEKATTNRNSNQVHTIFKTKENWLKERSKSIAMHERCYNKEPLRMFSGSYWESLSHQQQAREIINGQAQNLPNINKERAK